MQSVPVPEAGKGPPLPADAGRWEAELLQKTQAEWAKAVADGDVDLVPMVVFPCTRQGLTLYVSTPCTINLR